MQVDRIYRRFKFGKPIIVVSGLPRSGTSMLMLMLKAGGVEIATDNIRKADEDNPRGYFELEKVKQLDKNHDKSWLADLRGKAVKIISYRLKDLPDSYNYKVIFMERNIREVIVSQNKMLVHRGEAVDPATDEKLFADYEHHLRKTKYMLNKEPQFEALFIEYGKVLNNPAEQAEIISRFIDGHLDKREMVRMVDPNLYRNRQ